MTLLMNRWVQLGAALALAVLFFWLWLGKVEEVGAAETERDVAVMANSTNQSAITELEAALGRMVEERKADAQQREDAMAQRDRELQAANKAADKARRERDALFQSSPSCEQLARLDIGAMCPGMAKRLQERSRGGGNPDGGDPGRGG